VKARSAALLRRLLETGSLLVLSAACRGGPAQPITAVDLAKDERKDALSRYLAQKGATAAVCNRASPGPQAPKGDAESFEALTDALLDGSVPPKLFQRCAMLLLESAPADEASLLLDELAHTSRALLSSKAIETDPERQAILDAVHGAVLLRKPETAPHADAIEDDLAALRDALENGRLGPKAQRYGKELLAGIELERGQWKGKPVTAATLDHLERQKDASTLRRMMQRLPDATMKQEARRRLARLHIAASPSAYVRANASEIEDKVVETGRNAIDPSTMPAQKGFFDGEKSRVKGVLVRQNVWKQTATLLAFEGSEPGSSLLGSVDLRGALFLRVDGLDEPITLCAPSDALDPTPCLSPTDIKPKVPIAYVDDKGLLHFVEKVTSRDAMRLVYETPNLPLPFEVRGKEVLTIEWPLVYESPGSVVFTGSRGTTSPDLQVVLERRRSPRLFFEVKAPQGAFVGVVEEGDRDSFLIATRGAPGTPGTAGSPGTTGSAGSMGMAASCPGSRGGNGGNGGRGGNGGPGGPGGPGGDAGDVSVRISCLGGDCGNLADLAARMVRSEGGPGGPGGRGGPGGAGGPGGSGGSGTSCFNYTTKQTTYVGGGSPGSAGSPGSTGANGPPGAPGRPGKVSIQVVR
jgi:hypothetical protein